MSTPDDREAAALVALLRRERSFTSVIHQVLEHGSAMDVLLPADTLFEVSSPGLEAAATEIGQWLGQGIGLVTFLDAQYPAQLREVQEMPPLLFYRGSLRSADRAVSVVGSRRASDDGLRFSREVSRGLVDAGISVVAGLAVGVDTAAHEAALVAGGRTVAVIGTGIQRCYPSQNEPLQERIAEEGLLLSQFWPDASPSKKSFPMRNAIMSGYGRASIIVEAGEFSGTRSQVRMAVAHGRPVILTRSVAELTSWGRDLAGNPAVFVVDTATQAVELAERHSTPLQDLLSSSTVD